MHAVFHAWLQFIFCFHVHRLVTAKLLTFMQIHISTNAIEKCNVVGKLFRLRNITSSITYVTYLHTHFCIYEFPVKAWQIHSPTIMKSLYKTIIKFFILQQTLPLLRTKTKVQTDRENASYASTEVKVLEVNHVSAHRYFSFFFFLRVVCIQTGQVKRRRKFAVLRIQMAISL